MRRKAAWEDSPHEAIRSVLVDWYDADPSDLDEVSLTLEGLGKLAKRWPIFQQNQLLDPPKPQGDRTLFLVENQGVFMWATEDGDENAAVWGRWNEPSGTGTPRERVSRSSLCRRS
jgi:hypothetical protein